VYEMVKSATVGRSVALLSSRAGRCAAAEVQRTEVVSVG
jgi:hypothetical protein